MQVHLTYKFTRTMWLAGDANYFTGGRTTIGGKQNLDLQRNSRIGATFSSAIGRRPGDPHVGEPRRLHDDRRGFHFDRRSATTTRGRDERETALKNRIEASPVSEESALPAIEPPDFSIATGASQARRVSSTEEEVRTFTENLVSALAATGRSPGNTEKTTPPGRGGR